MPGRTYQSATSYRYGFNGKENDNEVKGTGNQQDYGMRIYDPRLGRFLSVDPLTRYYPHLTPYQFASNRPIDGVDLDGLEHATYYFAYVPGHKPIFSSKIDHKQVGALGYGVQVVLVDREGNKTVTFVPTNAPPKPAEKTEGTVSIVLTAGIQGGIEGEVLGAGVSAEGNMGSIDVIGFRDGKFVFMENPKRGHSAKIGVAGEETSQEFSSIPLPNSSNPNSENYGKSLETRITKKEVKLFNSNYGEEVVEQAIHDNTRQGDVKYKEVQKRNYSGTKTGISVSLGVGLEASYNKEVKGPSR